MPSTSPLQAFLAGKAFIIPHYQRDYAWTRDEIGELFDDVLEALETKTSHYLGTIVLAQAQDAFEVVDGQQRLTTIMLIVHALLMQLEESDTVRIADEIYLLKKGGTLKLDFGGNQAFVKSMLAGEAVEPATGGQRRLKTAYQYCHERAQAIATANNENIYKWLETIKNLEIIEFIEESAGRAIRIFQSLNDRGRQLNDMDKAKALLVLYSNRFLDAKLDSEINDVFGACFAAFDQIREQAQEKGYRIDSIARKDFSENDLLRYHYLAYDGKEANDYYGYSDVILSQFLKPALKDRKDDPQKLAAFISDYIHDLKTFATSFAKLIDATRYDVRIFTLLVIQGLAARLYPLTIRLHERSLLNISISEGQQFPDMLHAIGCVDLRVYKLRGTDPARDIGHISHVARTSSVQEIIVGLRSFVANFMPDGLMQTHLDGPIYKSGAAVPVLLAFEQHCTQLYDLPRLVELVQLQPTQEHILAQQPSFDYRGVGFKTETEFVEYIAKIGNLTLLTASENSSCNALNATTKMTRSNLYLASKFNGPRLLAHDFNIKGSVFDKATIISRTAIIRDFAVLNWSF